MLTGDNRRTGEAVAARLGIDEVIADVLPQDKDVTISRLKQEGRIVAMAGEGVNDAPAIARADIGIAMGTAAAGAAERAGGATVKGDTLGIVPARRISCGLRLNFRQHLLIACDVNASGLHN